jgi:hypothetical protein
MKHLSKWTAIKLNADPAQRILKSGYRTYEIGLSRARRKPQKWQYFNLEKFNATLQGESEPASACNTKVRYVI